MWYELVIFCEGGQVRTLKRALLKAGAAIFDEDTCRLTAGGDIVDFVFSDEVRRSYSESEWQEVISCSTGDVPVLVLATSKNVAATVLRDLIRAVPSKTMVDDGNAPLRLMTMGQLIHMILEA